MTTPAADEKSHFELIILPHLDAAYNLARGLTGNENDARDMAQEASLRAFKFFAGFRGGDARAWLLTIVRNTVYTWLERRRSSRQIFEDDDEIEKLVGRLCHQHALPAEDDRALRRQQLVERGCETRGIAGRARVSCLRTSWPKRW